MRMSDWRRFSEFAEEPYQTPVLYSVSDRRIVSDSLEVLQSLPSSSGAEKEKLTLEKNI